MADGLLVDQGGVRVFPKRRDALRGAVAVCVSVLGVAAVGGCAGVTPSSGSTSPSTPSASASTGGVAQASLRKFVGEVLPSDVNPASIPGLVPMTSGSVSAPFALVSWPRWDKASKLSESLEKVARDGEREFLNANQGSVYSEYNMTWSVTQATDRYAAVNLSVVENAGANDSLSFSSHIERIPDQTLVPVQSLFVPEAEKSLRGRLPALAKTSGITLLPDDGIDVPEPILKAASIDRHGDLIVPISEGTVAPHSEGALLLTLPRGEANHLLSDEGKAYAASAMGAPSAQDQPAPGVGPNASDSLKPTPAPTSGTDGVGTDGVAPESATAESAAADIAAAAAGGPDCSKLKCVALTFDDGPGPQTATVLNTLRDQGAKATFYLVGRSVTADPATVKRMVAEGHAVGNHTWTHPDLKRLGPAEVREQLRRTTEAIKAAAGVGPTSLRPPYGNFGKSTPSEGLPVILWDVDTLDWKTRSTSKTISSAVSGARAGSIILMHDIHATTVAAVPEIVRQLKAKGFTMVTIPQLLPKAKGGTIYTSATS